MKIDNDDDERALCLFASLCHARTNESFQFLIIIINASEDDYNDDDALCCLFGKRGD
jgi:hypothetical protein